MPLPVRLTHWAIALHAQTSWRPTPSPYPLVRGSMGTRVPSHRALIRSARLLPVGFAAQELILIGPSPPGGNSMVSYGGETNLSCISFTENGSTPAPIACSSVRASSHFAASFCFVICRFHQYQFLTATMRTPRDPSSSCLFGSHHARSPTLFPTRQNLE